MTIFHVLKYPVPEWQTSRTEGAISFMSEDMRSKFLSHANFLYDSSNWSTTNELHNLYTELYIRTLMEWEEP